MKKDNDARKDFIKMVYQVDEPTEEMSRKLDFALKELTDKEERVLRLRFGLDDNIMRTYKEIGDEFGLTGSRIYQIVKKAIRKLHHPIRKRKVLC